MVQGQSGQKIVRFPPSQSMAKQDGTSVNPATKDSTNRRIVVQAGPGKKQDTISKITKGNRTSGMAQW
jgi:hypothetical protein